MLRKYYNCNNSVTNVESGSRSAIVKSGDQIRHHQIRDGQMRQHKPSIRSRP